MDSTKPFPGYICFLESWLAINMAAITNPTLVVILQICLVLQQYGSQGQFNAHNEENMEICIDLVVTQTLSQDPNRGYQYEEGGHFCVYCKSATSSYISLPKNGSMKLEENF